MALSPVCLCLDALQLPAQRGELLVVVRDELAVVARVCKEGTSGKQGLVEVTGGNKASAS